MKLAKFIYPMFLVALGLHGLLLFVPVGGTSEAELIEEDVELSELPTSADANPADANAKAALNGPVGPLPVPNLNISGATPANPATTAAAVRAAPRVAVRQPVAGATPRASTTQSAARPASGRSSQRGSASAGSERSQTSPQSQERRNNTPRTNLPNLNAATTSATESATASISAGSDRNVSGTISLSRLIASVTNSAPEALQSLRSDFAKDYAYVDKNTDAAGLEDRRSRWIDKISLLANVESNAVGSDVVGTNAVAEKIEPIVLSDSKLSYPIEHSARSDRRASRICLDDPPPNDAEVAVLFDAQGNVVGTPEMTLSSGYPAIDREIIAIILAEGGTPDSDSNASEAEGFSDTRQSKAYLRAFEIDYAADRCLTLPKLKE